MLTTPVQGLSVPLLRQSEREEFSPYNIFGIFADSSETDSEPRKWSQEEATRVAGDGEVKTALLGLASDLQELVQKLDIGTSCNIILSDGDLCMPLRSYFETWQTPVPLSVSDLTAFRGWN